MIGIAYESMLQLSSPEEVDVVSNIVDEIEDSPSQSFAYEKHTAFHFDVLEWSMHSQLLRGAGCVHS